jgi:hypothetical protein
MIEDMEEKKNHRMRKRSVSLNPLSLEEALKDLLQVKPEHRKPKKKKE